MSLEHLTGLSRRRGRQGRRRATTYIPARRRPWQLTIGSNRGSRCARGASSGWRRRSASSAVKPCTHGQLSQLALFGLFLLCGNLALHTAADNGKDAWHDRQAWEEIHTFPCALCMLLSGTKSSAT